MRIGDVDIPNGMVVNAAAGLVAILLIVLLGRQYLMTDQIAQCSDRYNDGVLFAHQDAAGKPLHVSELQARLGGRDVGVSENLEIVRLADAPGTTAMRVKLAAVAAADGIADADRIGLSNGIGFEWSPSRLPDRARALCLTYSVRLPKNFKTSNGGFLPGLFGGKPGTTALDPAGFSTRYRWNGDGRLDIRVVSEATPKGQPLVIDAERVRLPLGRWTRLEQEVILNTPGQANGVVRVWIDGELHLDKGGLALRSDGEMAFEGVIANVAYVGRAGGKSAIGSEEAVVDLSAFEVRWPARAPAR
jgi:YD repeat-containing protein